MGLESHEETGIEGLGKPYLFERRVLRGGIGLETGIFETAASAEGGRYGEG